MEDVARAVTGGLQVLAEVRGADRRSMYQVVARPTSPNSPNTTDLGVIVTSHQFGSHGDTVLDGSDGEVLDLRMRTEHLELRLDRIAGISDGGAAASPALKPASLNDTLADLDSYRHGVQPSFIKSPLRDLLDTVNDDDVLLYEEEDSLLVEETEKQHQDWACFDDKYDEAYEVVFENPPSDLLTFVSPEHGLVRARSLDNISVILNSSLLAATQPDSPDISSGMESLSPGQSLRRSRSLGRLRSVDFETLYSEAAEASLPNSVGENGSPDHGSSDDGAANSSVRDALASTAARYAHSQAARGLKRPRLSDTLSTTTSTSSSTTIKGRRRRQKSATKIPSPDKLQRNFGKGKH